MPNPWLVLRHVEHEHIGTLDSVLAAQRISYHYLDLHRGHPVPATIAGTDGLVVMGGPMGVYEEDRYAFISPELKLIALAANAGLPVIGICLGAQMIAAALGGRVFAGDQKEIGWFPVRNVASADRFTSTLPESFMAFHWHGDTFDLPSGAIRLFESDRFTQQGFRWGNNVLALQFHFEVDRRMVGEWLDDEGCQAEIAKEPDVTATAILRATRQYGATLENLSADYFTAVLQQLTT